MTRKPSKTDGKSPYSDLIVSIRGIEFDIKIDESIYDEAAQEDIRHIVRHMSKEIWIDKTYVDFKGTRWPDAYMVEEKWNEFMKLVWDTNFGRNATDREESEITQCLVVMSATYLYLVLKNFDYDIDYIDLEFKPCDFYSKYDIDTRKEWLS